MRCKVQDFIKGLFTTILVVLVPLSFLVTGLEASANKDLRFSIGLKGGYSFWSLDDLGISQKSFGNWAEILDYNVTAEELKGSLFGGIDLSLEFKNLGLSAGFQYFPGGTFENGLTSAFESLSSKLDLSAFVIPVELYYKKYVTDDFFLKFGAGLDYYKATADYDFKVNSDGGTYYNRGKLMDSGLGGHVSLGAQYFLNKNVALTLDADYSFAKLDNFTGTLIDLEGTETEVLLTMEDSELGEILGTYPVTQSLPPAYRPAKINFSGFNLSVGFNIFFVKRYSKGTTEGTNEPTGGNEECGPGILISDDGYRSVPSDWINEDTNGDGKIDTWTQIDYHRQKLGDFGLPTPKRRLKKKDIDYDGDIDEEFEQLDLDGNGKADYLRVDTMGHPDPKKRWRAIDRDTDRDGDIDYQEREFDKNADGKADIKYTTEDTNNDGKPDRRVKEAYLVRTTLEDTNMDGRYDKGTKEIDVDGDGKYGGQEDTTSPVGTTESAEWEDFLE